MKLVSTHNVLVSVATPFLVCFFIAGTESIAQGSEEPRITDQATGPQLIQPEDLVRILKSTKDVKPLIIHVGFRILYVQAHIPGSEYFGPASSPEGIQQLRKRVGPLPRTQSIVLYCGCCPWDRCPNVNPAYRELQAMGFKSVKILYIAQNLGADWVQKGYPVAKGES